MKIDDFMWCWPLIKLMICLLHYLHHRRWRRLFSPLSVFVCLSFLCAGYLKKLWMDPDETLWTRWVCDKEELIQFWWRSKSGSDNFLSDSSPLRDRARNDMVLYGMIFQKCNGLDMFSWIRPWVVEVCALPSALLVTPWICILILSHVQYVPHPHLP